jgi:hypothetical protein
MTIRSFVPKEKALPTDADKTLEYVILTDPDGI